MAADDQDGEARDAALWRRLATGDGAALADIYDAHARRLYGLALWLLGDASEAEDVVQELFLKLSRAGAGLLAVKRPRAYLMAMAHRQAMDVLRARQARRQAPATVLESLFASTTDDPARGLEARELARALGALDPAQREAVYLRVYQGMSFREIGQAAGVSLFTAASRYRLGLGVLAAVAAAADEASPSRSPVPRQRSWRPALLAAAVALSFVLNLAVDRRDWQPRPPDLATIAEDLAADQTARGIAPPPLAVRLAPMIRESAHPGETVRGSFHLGLAMKEI